MRSLTKATHHDTREHNVRLVMRALAGLGPISRADIARRTDLTRTTVSDVVNQLAAAGLVQEIGRGPSSGGKAPILLQILGMPGSSSGSTSGKVRCAVPS